MYLADSCYSDSARDPEAVLSSVISFIQKSKKLSPYLFKFNQNTSESTQILSSPSFKTYLRVKLSFNSIALFILGKRGLDNRGPLGFKTERAGWTEVSPGTVGPLFSM